MTEFKVTDGKNNFLLNLPTSISEITPEYLTEVTKHIVVAPYHAVIATVYRCKLPEVISSHKKSRAMAISIVPIFVKCEIPNNDDNDFTIYRNLKCGDKIVIAGSDIERGYQLSAVNNFITIDNIVKIYNYDNEFAKIVMRDQKHYYFVDFKLVPINDIKGYYNEVDKDYNNPFAKVIEKEATLVDLN